jgi:hypothetical protein
MVLVLDKKSKIKKTKQKVATAQQSKGFDAYSFLGKIKNWDKLNAVDYQKKIRNEW